MVEWFMQAMAPRSVLGFIGRLFLLVGVVAMANAAFGAIFYAGHSHPPAYYIAHATIVGGPLIAFFLAVTVFQIRLQRKLWRLSRKDGLTGLNNRRTFFEIAQTRGAATGSAVLLVIDADRFKVINDTYGHQAGDNCLKSIAYTIKRNIRKEDLAGRIGGEEFAVYLRETTLGQARVIGERLTKPITFRSDDDQPLSITLSIGAATVCHGDNLEEVFARADRALYQAKLEGRARIIFAPDAIAA